jgi:hypothetical protein
MMEALHDFVLPYSSPVRNVRVAARGKQMKSKSLLTTAHPTPRRRRRTLVDIVIRLVARSTVAAAHSRVTCTAAVNLPACRRLHALACHGGCTIRDAADDVFPYKGRRYIVFVFVIIVQLFLVQSSPW